jgi:hypothetical protein
MFLNSRGTEGPRGAPGIAVVARVSALPVSAPEILVEAVPKDLYPFAYGIMECSSPTLHGQFF